jgi:hypothetical protein
LSLVLAVTAVRADVANKLESYTVTAARALKPDCGVAGFNDIRIAEFEQGVCLFHKASRAAEETQAAFDAFRQAQVKGLPPAHQNFAALASGIMNCQQAQADLSRFKASNNQNLMEQTRFCRDRRISAADFGDIRWDQAFFEYENSTQPNFNLDARLTEMGVCYATVLDPAFDAECGLISNVSENEINIFVDEAAGEVIEKYFSGVESPITAMFARKNARAEGLKDSAAAGIADLKSSAAEVNSAHDALNAAYLAAREEKIAKTYNNYRDAILRANTILDEFNRWKGGLFITSEGVNLLPKIVERVVEITEELARVQELGFLGKSDGLVADVRKTIDAKTETAKITAQLCRIYFCELANRRSMEQTIRACRRPALAGNPLCITQDETLRSGVLTVQFEGQQTSDIKSLCAAAGLDGALTEIGLGPQPAASCLAAMP